MHKATMQLEIKPGLAWGVGVGCCDLICTNSAKCVRKPDRTAVIDKVSSYFRAFGAKLLEFKLWF